MQADVPPFFPLGPVRRRYWKCEHDREVSMTAVTSTMCIDQAGRSGGALVLARPSLSFSPLASSAFHLGVARSAAPPGMPWRVVPDMNAHLLYNRFVRRGQECSELILVGPRNSHIDVVM